MRRKKQEEEPATFTTGFLYKDYRIVEYAPEKLLCPNQLIPAQQVNFADTMRNDCLTYTINQAVRHPFFTKREQVQNLWATNAKKSLAVVNERKVEKGVSFGAFRDFFVKEDKINGDKVYSVEVVAQFDGRNSNAAEFVKQFVKKNMIESNEHKQIVVTCSKWVNREVLSHAGTFLRQEHSNGDFKLLKYYDPNENHFFERGGHPINYQTFGKYEVVTILALKARPIKNDAEKEWINNKMKYIMTGEKDEEYIKERIK